MVELYHEYPSALPQHRGSGARHGFESSELHRFFFLISAQKLKKESNTIHSGIERASQGISSTTAPAMHSSTFVLSKKWVSGEYLIPANIFFWRAGNEVPLGAKFIILYSWPQLAYTPQRCIMHAKSCTRAWILTISLFEDIFSISKRQQIRN